MTGPSPNEREEAGPHSPPGCWGLQAAPPPRCARRLQVGAVGTLVATFIKRDQVKDRLKCVYCDGTGIIQ